jgi:hypothetical protein
MLTSALLGLFMWFDWKTLKTDDFTIIYKEKYYWAALHTLQNLDYYKDKVAGIIGPSQRNLPVVIEDVGAVSNGFANPIFHNIHIFTHAPGFAYRIEGIENWYRAVTVHEYAHILHLSRTTGISKVLTDVFGSFFAPNLYSPGWIIEGITVYCESQTTPYEGRLNDGFFDSYIAARVQNEAMPSIIEATNTPFEFPFGTYYLYGGEFFNYLSQTYGEGKFQEFFSIYSRYFWAPLSAILPYTGLDIAARRAYGKSYPSLFVEWQHYEKARHEKWRPAGFQLTDRGWYMYSLREENEKLYYIRYQPIRVDGFSQRNLIHIVEFDTRTETERLVASLPGTISTPLRIANGKIYYTTREFARGYPNVYYGGLGVVANLHERDLVTGVDRILFSDGIRGFCILSDGSVLYSKDKSHGYGSELWLFDNDKNIMIFETELLIGELDANDHVVALVARRDYENWNVYLLDCEGDTLVPLVATPWIEGNINLMDDMLVFTANYGRAYAIYTYDLATDRLHQLTSTGYADHGVIIDNTLYFTSMTKHGFDLYKTEFDPKEIALIDVSTSTRPNFEDIELKIGQGGYGDVLKTLLPSVRVPFVLPTKSDFSAWSYGLFLLGGDATDENLYGGFLAWDSDKEDFISNILWQSRVFSPLDISFFYDYRNSFEYTLNFSAFVSLEYGFSYLYLFLNGRVFDGNSRKEYVPGFTLGFKYPYTTLSASLALPFERQAWGSDIHRSAQEMSFSVERLLAGGEVRIKGMVYVDRDNPDTPDFSIRGYDAILSRRALVVSTEYSRRLCKVRKGLWNPNVYFEDLYWTIFADYALTEEGTTPYSAGVELCLETKVGFGFLHLVPKIGIALTESRALKIFLGISPGLPI